MSRNISPSNEKIALGDLTNARFRYQDDWTFAIFFRVENISGNRSLITKFDAASNTQQAKFIVRTTGRIRFLHNTSAQSVQTAGSISLNTWYMAAVINASSTITLYWYTLTSFIESVNSTLSGNVSVLTTPLNLGLSENNQEDFDGDLAFSMYYSTALTQLRLEQYWKNPVKFAAQNKTSCEFFLPLGLSSPDLDWSGNENSGTLTGTTIGNNPPIPLYFYNRTPQLIPTITVGAIINQLQKNNVGADLFNGALT